MTTLEVPKALHRGESELPFVNLGDGAELQLLQVDVEAGLWVIRSRFARGTIVPTHKHTGEVFAFTLAGSWKYVEYPEVNVAGSYLYEPPGSVHTLSVPADNTEVTETLTVVYGRTEYIGDGGEVIAVSDTASNLAMFYESCEAAGIPRPTAILK